MKLPVVAAMALALAPTVAQAAAVGTTTSAAANAEEMKRLGSYYLRCDGQPNNMTDAESFARLLGAVTLLALFAPSPEAANPSKRLFGQEGVDACSRLLDDPKEETNGLRRLPLILARANHRIEAKGYQGAVADVAKARSEAQTLGLVGNPYFERSLGLSFSVIEASAQLRAGDAAAAREAGLQNSAKLPHSFYANVASRDFAFANRTMSEAELAHIRTSSKIMPSEGIKGANRLEEVGRFAEAAELREGIVKLLDAFDTDSRKSWALASAAISHALAGNWDRAALRAEEARTNLQTLEAAGKPEDNRANVIEMLDLYAVLKLAHEGKLDDARRNFAARSQWTGGSFGAVLAANRLLRTGARPEQLFGALEKTPDELWDNRRKLFTAQLLETDTNNRTLYSFILPYAPVAEFEALSKNVWRTDKSRIISAEPVKNSKFWSLAIFGGPMTQPDALLLHAAVQAKARGYKGFVYFGIPNSPQATFVQFGNPGDPDIAEPFYLDADAVIAELQQVIPTPEVLSAKRRARK